MIVPKRVLSLSTSNVKPALLETYEQHKLSALAMRSELAKSCKEVVVFEMNTNQFVHL